MRAIFLSAGRGTRMLPLTKNNPKPLIDIDSGSTVIDFQLNSLLKTDINEVVYVTGYLTDMIEEKLKEYNDKIKIKVVYNPFYDVSNNLVSAWVARSEMDEDFILINGDNIFHHSVLNDLIREDKTKEICMVIDKKDEYSSDDMKVSIDGNRILRINKKIPTEETHGESVGIIRFTKEGKKHFKEILETIVREKENLSIFYLAAIQKLVDNGLPVNFMVIPDNMWAEIDFHEDLKYITKEIHDRLKHFRFNRY